MSVWFPRVISLLAVGSGVAGMPAAEAANCPAACARATRGSDADLDGVVDTVECFWCNKVEEGVHPLWLDPGSPDSDGDGHGDAVDAYPGDPNAWGELEFSGADCSLDPFPAKLVKDPEFDDWNHQVMWLDEEPANQLWAADVDPEGFFVNPVLVDDTVIDPNDNGRNGPEWLYSGADGGVILYTKPLGSTQGELWRARRTEAGWITDSLGVNGIAPLGTLWPGDSRPAITFVKHQPTGKWTHHFCWYDNCADTVVQLGNVHFNPPDILRFGEGVGDASPVLVGVDYTDSPRQAVSWDPTVGHTTLTDDALNKYHAWMWTTPDGTRLLFTKQMLPTYGIARGEVEEGPGVIGIYYDDAGTWRVWQMIPVGALGYPYVASAEPFVAHTGTSYILFAASKRRWNYESGPSQVILAEVASARVANPSGVDTRLILRRIDDATTATFVWKDPEDFIPSGGDRTLVYVKEYSETPPDTRICATGPLN